MNPDILATEVILTHPRQSLGNVQLDWTPQPGSYLDLEGKTYAVLERRHRYQLKLGRYHLHKIAIYVQSAQRPVERTLVGGCWVIGDATCKYIAVLLTQKVYVSLAATMRKSPTPKSKLLLQ
jgi:Family of unknown function (DUF6464)